MNDHFRKMALEVNAGQRSEGDFVDGMCHYLDDLIGQKDPAKDSTQTNGK